MRPASSRAAAASHSRCRRTGPGSPGARERRAARWLPTRKMALTVPAESTGLMARARHWGNCVATNSRTVLGEMASWPGCMSTPAASRVPLFSCNRLSAAPGGPQTRHGHRHGRLLCEVIMMLTQPCALCVRRHRDRTGPLSSARSAADASILSRVRYCIVMHANAYPCFGSSFKPLTSLRLPNQDGNCVAVLHCVLLSWLKEKHMKSPQSSQPWTSALHDDKRRMG